jgi:hypothetical protein
MLAIRDRGSSELERSSSSLTMSTAASLNSKYTSLTRSSIGRRDLACWACRPPQRPSASGRMMTTVGQEWQLYHLRCTFPASENFRQNRAVFLKFTSTVGIYYIYVKLKKFQAKLNSQSRIILCSVTDQIRNDLACSHEPNKTLKQCHLLEASSRPRRDTKERVGYAFQ